MASIFVSHSSKDDTLASDLDVWLNANGFTDTFIDHTSIRAGAKWADALRASAGACRVVLFLITENWLASEQCVGEFNAAWYMGKRLLPLFLTPPDLPEAAREILKRVEAEDQGLDIRPVSTRERRLDFTRDEACADRLRVGLRSAGALSVVGLDPDAFEIDRKLRPAPFPGLSAFGDDDADAAVFFGRSREVAETMEELRAMRAARDHRVLVILGASGAGKSSLLKAGIIPRLRREAPAWIPLRAFRPGADPLLNFAEAIGRTLTDFEVREPDWTATGTLRRRMFEAWQGGNAAETLASIAERLRVAANRPGGTILVGIDQAEELARSEGESGDALATYLRAAIGAGGVWRLAFTIRSDSFSEMQAHPRFQELEARGYDLRALPTFRFGDVVSQPAKRYGVEFDHTLVDQLMEDAPGRDALPLLAFALQRLWDQFAAQGRIGLADYQSMGGLSGLIEDAAERALAGQAPEQANAARSPVRAAQDELGSKTFVPLLADVNEEGAAMRRVATWQQMHEDSRAMLDHFASWRLVVMKGDAGTIEVAHEALFRAWPRLEGWLQQERARLETLRDLTAAAAAWQKHERAERLLLHSGKRLRSAAKLKSSKRYLTVIEKCERDYLSACQIVARKRAIQASFFGVLVIAAPVAVHATIDEKSPVRLAVLSSLLASDRIETLLLNELGKRNAQLKERVRSEFAAWIKASPDSPWYAGQSLSIGPSLAPDVVRSGMEFLSAAYNDECGCWRETLYSNQARHAISTYWIVRAYLNNGSGIPKGLATSIVGSQQEDGSWSLQTDSDSGGSAGATAFSILTLQLLTKDGLSVEEQVLVRRAQMAARKWLLATATSNGSWSSYPKSGFYRSQLNRGVSALCISALLQTFPQDGEIISLGRKWADALDSTPELSQTSASTEFFEARTSEVFRRDATSYVMFGWEVLALAQLAHQDAGNAPAYKARIGNYITRPWKYGLNFVNAENAAVLSDALNSLGAP